MSSHKCMCGFIPPFILQELAKTEQGNARLTLQQSKISRAKRSAKVVSMEAFAGISPPGQGPRKVYDCQNQWQQRVQLVRSEGDPDTGDAAVDKVYDYVGIVRDYFKTVLNRNSYDHLGSDVIVNVHHGIDYNNAFWDGDELTFGDGDGTIFVSFAKSLDVIAHEFGHGVVQFTANFDYYSQPGALHEHFADVFGSAITQHYHHQTADEADWLIGDEIMGPELYGEALRSMKAPGSAYNNPLLGKDPQPDHMKDYYAGPGDNQGVHINSGIPNKAFYLVAKEIGTEKAVLIWYHGLQNLWFDATFNDAVEMIVRAARILTKNGKLPLGSAQIVRWAFQEVGLPN